VITPIVTAFRTLTVLPVPGKDTKSFSRSLGFFWTPGVVLGGWVYLFFAAEQWTGGKLTMLVALGALASQTLLTGGLHLDGLGDVAAAFGGGRARPRVLAILKDPHMGAFGVCAIVLGLLLKAGCWYYCFEFSLWWVVCGSLVLSRSAMALALALLPNARPDGTAGVFARRSWGAVAASVTAFVAVVGCGMWLWGTVAFGIPALGAVFAAIALVLWFVWRIGGITGDCLGALNETAEIVFVAVGLVYAVG
jgi:adenosylcobinamide-GDP ribazoletransferase